MLRVFPNWVRPMRKRIAMKRHTVAILWRYSKSDSTAFLCGHCHWIESDRNTQQWSRFMGRRERDRCEILLISENRIETYENMKTIDNLVVWWFLCSKENRMHKGFDMLHRSTLSALSTGRWALWWWHRWEFRCHPLSPENVNSVGSFWSCTWFILIWRFKHICILSVCPF